MYIDKDNGDAVSLRFKHVDTKLIMTLNIPGVSP